MTITPKTLSLYLCPSPYRLATYYYSHLEYRVIFCFDIYCPEPDCPDAGEAAVQADAQLLNYLEQLQPIMRPHHFVLVCLGVVGLPTLLIFSFLMHTHPRGDLATENTSDSPKSTVRALFSFHTPSTLFPPSAIISLTDDNSTFFLARPADFGPSLAANGLSGQLWIGSGFGEDGLGRGSAGTGAEGELGCSDVPGWEDGTQLSRRNAADQGLAAPEAAEVNSDLTQAGSPTDSAFDAGNEPHESDGTDDYLHHPLPSSPVSKPTEPGLAAQHPPREKDQESTHADIQSIQEGAEIAGKVVLLSRGGCGFLEKVKWAQRRGATALIVGDHTRGGPLITMYARGDTSNVSIPSLFTSHTTAHLLSSLIPSDASVEENDGAGGSEQGFAKEGIKAIATDHKPTFTGASKSKRASAASQFQNRRRYRSNQIPRSEKKRGWLGSIFGMGSDRHTSGKSEDSRRPPSSGRHDWFSGKYSDEPSQKQDSRSHHGEKTSDDSITKSGSTAKGHGTGESHIDASDDFVIGVQDWRDPDMAAKPSLKTESMSTASSSVPTPLASNALYKIGDSVDHQLESSFSGGSITPGSGQYNKPGYGSESLNRPSDSDNEDDQHFTTDTNSAVAAQRGPPYSGIASGGDHEGLWVTLTPTTMSTSPFFDTLLVLVVSPLVTLTVVYALLLLRSRIRRRRWRAPKSVVDRLPVRTYHTMSCASTTSSSRIATPQSTSPSSPLLYTSPRSVIARPRARSATVAGMADAVSASLDRATNASVAHGEKRTVPTKRRQKYDGKQVECVVCLEEYVDGESRVMSLPCGHEFHAECM